MKIAAFLGSPRKGGNTELLLKESIRGIEEIGFKVEIFNLNSLNIQPCQNCGGCESTGQCIIHDDMERIYEVIRTADRVILASPIFFLSLPAQTKRMIDRCQNFWYEKYILKKPIPSGKWGRKGLLILVGGMKNKAGIRCAELCARAFFRVINVLDHQLLSFAGIDKKGEILHHPQALKEAYEAGKRLATY